MTTPVTEVYTVSTWAHSSARVMLYNSWDRNHSERKQNFYLYPPETRIRQSKGAAAWSVPFFTYFVAFISYSFVCCRISCLNNALIDHEKRGRNAISWKWYDTGTHSYERTYLIGLRTVMYGYNAMTNDKNKFENTKHNVVFEIKF